MNKAHTLVFLSLLIGVLPIRGQNGSEEGASYSDPGRFEEEIRAFEEVDQKSPPPNNAILCIGSSSMRGWHEWIREDLHPLTVIPRGFGGSNMNDVLHFADRIIIPYAPRAILLYEGDNDVAAGIPPETILETFHKLVEKTRDSLPEVRFYVLSLKPSVARWQLWPTAQETNRLLKEACDKDPLLTFIDIGANMLGENGEPKEGFFVEDDLHMTRPGYLSWVQAVRPILLFEELRYDPGT